jgi:drug/metabolite transporter (DMT)-like permease
MLNLIAWQMAAGILPICLFALAFPPPPAQWNGIYVLALVYVGVIATGIGFILWTAILTWLPAGTAALNMFAIPVLALLSSMLVFGERLTAAEWLGIVLIGIGLVTVSVRAWLASRRGDDVVEAPAIEGG